MRLEAASDNCTPHLIVPRNAENPPPPGDGLGLIRLGPSSYQLDNQVLPRRELAVTGSSQGTSYPEPGPYLDLCLPPRVAEQRQRPRRRPVESRPPQRRDAGHPLVSRPPLRRPVPMGVYAPVPCWWSRQRWLEHVERVYRRHYLLLRPRLVAVSGGGISLQAVLVVAGAHAAAADFGTGRDSRPVLGQTGGERGLTATTGLGARTITRARTFLRLAGVATEVQPGRHRTLHERLDSWERGDRARGWTAVYALHHTTTHPVDNLGSIGAGHTPDGTPPHSGSLPHSSSEEKVVTTGIEREDRGATRPASTTKGRCGRRRSVPDARGVLLATRWCQDPDSPPWARYKTPTTWAALLALPARHSWTVRDLHRLLADHTASGRRLLTHPNNPIAYLSWLLNQTDLANRPCAMDDVYVAYEAELAAHSRAESRDRLGAAAHAREAGRAALHGDAHHQVQDILTQRTRTAAAGKADRIRAEHNARTEFITRRRG